MTEERFWYDFEDPTGHKIVDFKNDKEYPLETIGDFREVVDLMNGLTAKNKVLHKEIERLKTQNEDILYNNAKNMELLEKENEQLKKEINMLKTTIGRNEAHIQQMKHKGEWK